MRLADLNPLFLDHGGPGVSYHGQPVARTEGVGLLCDCPCGDKSEEHQLYVPFANPIGPGPAVPDGGSRWQRTGETFETLTLTPSIQRIGGCAWHGFITDGEVRTC